MRKKKEGRGRSLPRSDEVPVTLLPKKNLRKSLRLCRFLLAFPRRKTKGRGREIYRKGILTRAGLLMARSSSESGRKKTPVRSLLSPDFRVEEKGMGSSGRSKFGLGPRAQGAGLLHSLPLKIISSSKLSYLKIQRVVDTCLSFQL